MLPDGTYDAIVVDVAPADGGRLSVELAILAGEHRGELVAVHAPAGGESSDGTALLGLPATLTVSGGVPNLRLEP